MTQICGERIKYIRNGFTMLEMAQEFDKRLIFGRIDVQMWEMA